MIREHTAAVLRPRDRSVMKAAVFTAPGRIVLDDKPVPAVGPGDALIRITTTTICGTDVHILKGEYPVAPGRIVGHEPVGVIDELGPARRRLHRRAARHRRRDHAVRAMPSLPGRSPRRSAARQGDGRLALRQHHRRLPGRVRARARRHGQPRADSRRPDRRAGADVPRHHVARVSAARRAATSGSATRSRCSRRARSACARPPGAKLQGRDPIIAVDGVPARLAMAQADGRRRRRRLSRTPIRSPRSCGSPAAAASTSRSRRSARSRRSRAACACSSPAARSPASASTRAS